MHSSQAAKHPAAKIQAQAKASISRPYLKTGTKLKSASYHDIKFMALTNFNYYQVARNATLGFQLLSHL